jgi:hypothetical protein
MLLELSSQDDDNKKTSMIVMGTTVNNNIELVHHQSTRMNLKFLEIIKSIPTLLWTKFMRLMSSFMTFVYSIITHSPITVFFVTIFRLQRPPPQNEHFRQD